MATLIENALSTENVKANIKSAIEAKGQDLTNVPFTEYADKISAIETGGSSISATLTPEMIAGIWKAVLGDESQIYIWAYYVFSLKEDEQGNKLMKMFSIDDFESGTFIELPYTISGNNVIVDENGDEPLEFTYSFEDGKMTLNSETFPVPLTKVITGMGENEDNINPLADVTENGLYTPKTLNDAELLFFGANVNVPTSSGGIDRLQWKCDNIKSLYYEFYNYKGSDLSILEGLDTSQVTNMEYAFGNCSNITSIPYLDTKNVTNFQRAFDSCSKLSSIYPLDLSNCKTLNHMFYSCRLLENIYLENINLSNISNFSYVFSQCRALKNMPIKTFPDNASCNCIYETCELMVSDTPINVGKPKSLNNAFRYCRSLNTEVTIDAVNCTDMSYCFYYTDKIPKITVTNTPNKINTAGVFYGCGALKDVFIDLRTSSNVSNLFEYCNALENVIVKNVKLSLKLGSYTDWGTKLTNASLLNTAQELWDNTGNALGGARTLTLSTPSKTAIQSIYVKLVDVTDEMRAEDEYIDNKKPCVECESTDDGAMTLEEYIISKNWQIG